MADAIGAVDKVSSPGSGGGSTGTQSAKSASSGAQSSASTKSSQAGASGAAQSSDGARASSKTSSAGSTQTTSSQSAKNVSSPTGVSGAKDNARLSAEAQSVASTPQGSASPASSLDAFKGSFSSPQAVNPVQQSQNNADNGLQNKSQSGGQNNAQNGADPLTNNSIQGNGEKSATPGSTSSARQSINNDPLASRYAFKLFKDATLGAPVDLMKAAAEKMKNKGMEYSAKAADIALKLQKATGGDISSLMKMGPKFIARLAPGAGLVYDILGNPSTANQGEAQAAAKWHVDNGKEVPQYVKDWIAREN